MMREAASTDGTPQTTHHAAPVHVQQALGTAQSRAFKSGWKKVVRSGISCLAIMKKPVPVPPGTRALSTPMSSTADDEASLPPSSPAPGACRAEFILVGAENHVIVKSSTDADATTRICTFTEHGALVTCLVVFDNLARVCSGSVDGVAFVWQVVPRAAGSTWRAEPLFRLEHLLVNPHRDEVFSPVTCAAVSSDSFTLVTGSTDGLIRVWHVPTAAVSSTGNDSCSPSSDSRDLEQAGPITLQPRAKIICANQHSASTGINALCLSRNGELLVTAGEDHTVRIWQLEEILALEANSTPTTPGRQSRRQKILRLLDLKTNRARRVIRRRMRRPTGPPETAETADTANTGEAAELRAILVPDEAQGDGVQMQASEHDSGTKDEANEEEDPVLAQDERESRAANGSWHDSVDLKGHEEAVTAVCFSPDESKIVSGDRTGSVCLWAVERKDVRVQVTYRRLSTMLAHRRAVTAVCVTEDGRVICSASADRTIALFSLLLGEHMVTLRGHESRVNALCPSLAAASVMVSGGADGSVFVWDREANECIQQFSRTTQTANLHGAHVHVTAVLCLPDNATVVSGHADGTVDFWNRHTGKLHAQYYDKAVDAEEEDAQTDEEDRTPCEPPAALFDRRWHCGPVLGMCASEAGDLLATVGGNGDGNVRLWRLAFDPRTRKRKIVPWGSVAGRPKTQSHRHGDSEDVVPLMSPLEFGTHKAASPLPTSEDVTVTDRVPTPEGPIWAEDRSPNRDGHCGAINAVAMNPNGKVLVTGSTDTHVKVWELGWTSGTIRRMHIVCRATIRAHEEAVTSVAVNADGAIVASVGMDGGRRHVWEASGEDGRRTYVTHPLRFPEYLDKSYLTVCAISPDQEHLLTGTSRRRIMIWSLANGTLMRTMLAHGDYSRGVSALDVLTSGIVVSGGKGNSITFWDLHQTRMLAMHTLRKGESHEKPVTAVAITPDGSAVVAGYFGGSLGVWDLTRQFPSPERVRIVFKEEVRKARQNPKKFAWPRMRQIINDCPGVLFMEHKLENILAPENGHEVGSSIEHEWDSDLDDDLEAEVVDEQHGFEDAGGLPETREDEQEDWLPEVEKKNVTLIQHAIYEDACGFLTACFPPSNATEELDHVERTAVASSLLPGTLALSVARRSYGCTSALLDVYILVLNSERGVHAQPRDPHERQWDELVDVKAICEAARVFPTKTQQFLKSIVLQPAFPHVQGYVKRHRMKRGYFKVAAFVRGSNGRSPDEFWPGQFHYRRRLSRPRFRRHRSASQHRNGRSRGNSAPTEGGDAPRPESQTGTRRQDGIVGHTGTASEERSSAHLVDKGAEPVSSMVLTLRGVADGDEFLRACVAACQKTGRYDCFESEVLVAVLRFKWNHHVSAQFFKDFMLYLLLVFSFTASALAFETGARSEQLPSQVMNFIPLLCTTALWGYFVWHEILQLRSSMEWHNDQTARERQGVDKAAGSSTLAVLRNNSASFRSAWWRTFKAHVCDVWNAMDVLVLWLVPLTVGAQIYDFLSTSDAYVPSSILVAVTSPPVYINILYYLQGYERSGVLTCMVVKIVFGIGWFLVILLTCILAFSVSFFVMFRAGTGKASIAFCPGLEEAIESAIDGTDDNDEDDFGIEVSKYSSFERSVLAMGNLMLGVSTVQEFEGSASFLATSILYVIFMVLVALILLNLLIAIMADKYDEVQEHAKAEWRFAQAQLILEYESIMRKYTPERLLGPHYLDTSKRSTGSPQYLQVLQPTNRFGELGEDADAWSGRVRAIRQQIITHCTHGFEFLERKVDANEERYAQQLRNLEKQIENNFAAIQVQLEEQTRQFQWQREQVAHKIGSSADS